MSTTGGSALVEALLALLLAGVAIGGMASAAATGARLLALARVDSAATALGREQEEALRAGPRGSGTDTVVRGDVAFVRAWSAGVGRGRPDRLAVSVSWPGHHVDVASEALP